MWLSSQALRQSLSVGTPEGVINMRAVLRYACASAGALVPAVLPEPPLPSSGEVLISMEFAPVCLEDSAFQASHVNTSRHFPMLVGVDGVGRVIAVGDQIENVRVGGRVFIPEGVHTWRQRLVVAADGLYALPKTVDPCQLVMLLRRPIAPLSGGARSNSANSQLRSLRRKIALVAHGRLKMPAPKVFPLWRIAEAVEEVRGGARVLLDLQATPTDVQENQAGGKVFKLAI